MRKQIYLSPSPSEGNDSLSPRRPPRGLDGALAAFIILAACSTAPDKGGRLNFQFPEVRKSRMLFSTNGGITQTFTNPPRLGTDPVTDDVSYRITSPAGYAGPITLDTATGVLSFGQAAYDKVTSSRTPETVTVEASHQGKTASYTFTLTDHFSPRDGHTSVVLGRDIYVLGGKLQGGTDNEVWRSPDGGATWDRLEASDPSKRFSARHLHSSVVRGSEIYVIAGAPASSNSYLNDVWKSADGKDWIQAAGASSRFITRSRHGSAVLGDAVYVVSGLPPPLSAASSSNIWKSIDGGTSWKEMPLSFVGLVNGTSIGRKSFGLEVLENALYLMGGDGGPSGGEDEVWRSSDDTTNPGAVVWTRVTVVGNEFSERVEHSSAVLGDALYVIGGRGSVGGTWTVRNDIWKSTDKGRRWTKVGENAEALGRIRHSSVVLDNAIYVIGGRKSSTRQNDVWRCTDSAAAGVTCVNVHKNP